tara:strand:+ start:2998 stop:3303 length:306 start_codon:yes stop_codon:yes gene_type:complete
MTTIILTACIISSLTINILLAWYVRKLLNYLEMTNDETKSVLSSLASYEEHLTEVYGKELFYGDATLEKLLKHTTEITDEVQNFVQANEVLNSRTEEGIDA